MAAGCAKALLVILSLFFTVVSLVFIAVGVIMVFMIDVVAGDAFDDAKDASASSGYTINGEASDLKEFPLIYEMGVVLMIFGCLLLVANLLGCFGICCTTCCRTLLLVVAIIMVVLIIAQTVVYTLFLLEDSVIHTEIKENVQQRIRDDYDENEGDAFTAAIIIINREGDCCGMEGVQDFGVKSHDSCDTQNENKGCYVKFQDLIQDNILYAGIAVAVFLFLQLIEVICAFKIYKDERPKINPF